MQGLSVPNPISDIPAGRAKAAPAQEPGHPSLALSTFQDPTELLTSK